MLRLSRRAVLYSPAPVTVRARLSERRLAKPTNTSPPKMNATKVVLDWIAAHPYQTAFQIVNGVIICTPAAATVPVLAALGFSSSGPVAGSSAAAIMSYFGVVPAGGWYAAFQSAAMGGYGASAAAGLAQAGATLSSVGGWIWARNSTAG